MSSKIKRKFSSSDEEQAYNIDAFKNHTSSFGLYEECALKINISKKRDYKDMFDTYIPFAVPDYLKHLELSEFGYNEISLFQPTKHLELSKEQRIFLNRLKYVLINNRDQAGRVEGFIQDLVDNFLEQCELEDGMSLHTMSCRLYLNIGEAQFSAHSDKEGRKYDEIILGIGRK